MICQLTYDEIPLTLTALRELRPHVAVLQAHIAEQLQHGYRLAAAMSDAEEARREGCQQRHLDSGTGPSRHDAHALYHASGLRVTSHHFSIGVSPGEAP